MVQTRDTGLSSHRRREDQLVGFLMSGVKSEIQTGEWQTVVRIQQKEIWSSLASTVFKGWQHGVERLLLGL